MAKKGGLGRGMDALFLDNSAMENENSSTMLNINEVEPNRNQPRKNFNQKALEELAKSIMEAASNRKIAVSELNHVPFQMYR